MSRDIARREQLERELREEVSFREQFIGILGHDLSKPIERNHDEWAAPECSILCPARWWARAGQIIFVGGTPNAADGRRAS